MSTTQTNGCSRAIECVCGNPHIGACHTKGNILVVQSVEESRGRNGFRKDNSGEKFAEREEDLLEHRTDGSDAFDTLCIGCKKFP